ncbi:hypothetical protein B0T22DRAFT_375671 [Podospora appendiculata]|uniref:rhomboid protease n=1 Tax=Podospora appendiculata TaxID=314037 RepID=A0AAE1CDZ9_9PEZI|nr:hypothetical protein B0T22DRAFT_375671 [Podospora appendiculata]
MATPTIASFNTQRARAYLFRLPLFTRACIVAILAFWVLSIPSSMWDLQQWGALIPNEMGLATLYRINTFPFIHQNVFHMVMNLLAVTPLLDRFESEHGTLISLAMFFGPLTTIPAIIYVFIERFVLGSNTGVMGASIWVFLLLGVEAIRTYKANPYFVVSTYSIPTWTSPLAVVLVTYALVPSSSMLGHLCGLGVGYVFGLGYLKFLAPPEKVLRWAETKLNLLGRLPHFVSIDQKTYGRFGVLPTNGGAGGGAGVAMGMVGSSQRLGP